MQHLTVAVIIPTYNRAALVQEAIRSLLAQTQIPDEIIVVDDGSTDNTADVLRTFSESVIVIFQTNKGLSAARNTGIKVSHADLITFLDSDDTLLTNSIQRRARILEEQPEYDVVYSDAFLTDTQGNIISKFSEFKPGIRQSGHVFLQFANGNVSPVHTFIFRRKCLEDVPLFDETLNTLEDYDFWLRMSVNHAFCYVNEPLANYRTHGGMMTLDMSDMMRVNDIKVQHRAIEMISFQQLDRVQKARIYTTHGAKYAVLGQTKEARKWFTKAILTAPTSMKVSTKAFALMAFTLLGSNGTRYLAAVRRQIRASLKRNTRWAYNRPPTKE